MTGAPSTRMSCRGLMNESGVRIRAAAATSAWLTSGGDRLDSAAALIIECGKSQLFPDGDRGKELDGPWPRWAVSGIDFCWAATGVVGGAGWKGRSKMGFF